VTTTQIFIQYTLIATSVIQSIALIITIRSTSRISDLVTQMLRRELQRAMDQLERDKREAANNDTDR